MTRHWQFTSESVTEGHPDKVADQISDAVLDAVLDADPDPWHARVACETLVNTGLVVVAGEIRTGAFVNIDTIVRETVSKIGYDSAEAGFDGRTCGVVVAIDEQSPDIAGGVDQALESRGDGPTDDEMNALGAGDQGMMFGYATVETDSLMPLPIDLAHRMARQLAAVRHSGEVSYLRPDGKTQVTVSYEDNRPVSIDRVLISTQHDPGVDLATEMVPELLEKVILPVMPADLAFDSENILINPSGKFELGGPQADAGLTGRKIIVDTYGGMARHGGGAFSGKDSTKVDRSAAYATRWVAKNIVAAGLAERAELQVAYAIGVAHPVSLMLETFGTEQQDPEKILTGVREVFDLRPAAIIRDLGLRQPIFAPTAAYGHFGREEFPWESTDRADALAAASGT
ncbi:methionine adenosyltransferase [Euzebya tangerina]|uniref:methionine adenosyltransferase n=1 Tax=Euzebya tangerina TaxID=591198 RepID=UPI000E3168B0|nr:methionine adenosyltransferase [Euzebya tangerina]